jgi:hypothetical protein
MNHDSKNHASSQLGHFFQSFECNNSAGNIPALITQFADMFMAAGPTGAQCVSIADFAVALPKRKQLFDSLGCQSTTLVSCLETRLDARFVMAETRWRMTFARDGEEPKAVLADSLYIVETAPEGLKIVFYLAHQDLVAMLGSHGILPA